MSDRESHFLQRLLDYKGGELPEDRQSFTSERQQTAQAFTLHVEWRDGRRAEGFAWLHYSAYRWTEEGEQEKLVLMFGARGIEILGLNLRVLLAHIREGQLNSIRELPTSVREQLKQANPDNLPIIAGIRTFPDFDEILKQIKGGEQDEQPTRRTGRA